MGVDRDRFRLIPIDNDDSRTAAFDPEQSLNRLCRRVLTPQRGQSMSQFLVSCLGNKLFTLTASWAPATALPLLAIALL